MHKSICLYQPKHLDANIRKYKSNLFLMKKSKPKLPVNPNGKNPLFIFKMKFKKIENIKEK